MKVFYLGFDNHTAIFNYVENSYFNYRNYLRLHSTIPGATFGNHRTVYVGQAKVNVSLKTSSNILKDLGAKLIL